VPGLSSEGRVPLTKKDRKLRARLKISAVVKSEWRRLKSRLMIGLIEFG